MNNRLSIKRQAFQSAIRAIKAGIGILGKRKGMLLAAHLVEELAPVISMNTQRGPIRFYCPGHIPLWRAETLLTKEPETLRWIDGFDEDDVFWDIGANVGVYSLYAALRPAGKVLAFEPAAVNYSVLNRNIEINRMCDRISSFCIAFAEVSCLDYLYMANTDTGGALHGFAEPVDWQGNSFVPRFKQGMLGFSIDDFIDKFNPPFPTHIKIDVDGIEQKIISGALQAIADVRLKSLFVELDTSNVDQHEAVVSTMEKAGMPLHVKEHARMFDNSEFASVYNHIFVRQ